MSFSEYAALGSTLAALMAILTAYGVVNKFKKDIQKDVEERLEARLKAMNEKIHSFKEAAAKDLASTKDIFNNEIKHLSEKIDALREENKTQHRQTMEQQAQLIDFIRQIVKD